MEGSWGGELEHGNEIIVHQKGGCIISYSLSIILFLPQNSKE